MALPLTADYLGIDTPTALALDNLDTDTRRHAAAAAVIDRRAELGLLAQLLRERDGTVVTVAQLEAADPAIADLITLTVA